MEDAEKPIPLSIVTGFLGSGKTTFLEHILSSPSLDLLALRSGAESADESNESSGHESQRPRIAVVMNEFAPGSSVERLLLQHINSTAATSTPAPTAGVGAEASARRTTPEVLDLPNGCLCCSIKSGGLRAIEQLIRTRGPFDHILLETSGYFLFSFFYASLLI